MKLTILMLGLSLLFSVNSDAMGFENLNFEAAMPLSNDVLQKSSDVLPSWTPTSEYIYYNGGHIGDAPPMLYVFDVNGQFYPPRTIEPIEGKYSLGMLTFFDSGLELAQTGLVPATAKTIRFSGWIVENYMSSGNDVIRDIELIQRFQLWLGDVELNIHEVGPMSGIRQYAASIPSLLVDSNRELKFITGYDMSVLLDDIQFSPIALPEPANGASLCFVLVSLICARRLHRI